MARKNIDNLNCSLANSLDLIGEWWTILILQEAFFGTRRFEDFLQHLGIARNILTDRLRKLSDNGILERVPIKEGGKRHEYKLTQKGRDLYPTLIVITQWGDRWLHPPQGAPIQFLDRTTGEEIADITVRAKDGRELKGYELKLAPGPGANDVNRERCQRLEDIWQQVMSEKKGKRDK